MSSLNQLELNAFKPIPNEMLERGIITLFRGIAPIADPLTLELRREDSKKKLFYDPTYLQKQLVEQLQGHILTHHQRLDVINVEGYDLHFEVRGIDAGEYRTVGAETNINLIDIGTPLNETIPIEEAIFTFELAHAKLILANQCCTCSPKQMVSHHPVKDDYAN